MLIITSLRHGFQALFFEIVESGLKDRFKVDEIPRVFKFCQYAKSEIPAPSAKVMKVLTTSVVQVALIASGSYSIPFISSPA